MKDSITLLPDDIQQVISILLFCSKNSIAYELAPVQTKQRIHSPYKKRRSGKKWCGPKTEVKILQKVKTFKAKMPDGLKAMAVLLLEEYAGKVFRREALTAMLQEQMSITRLQASGIVSDLLTTKLIKIEKRTDAGASV